MGLCNVVGNVFFSCGVYKGIKEEKKRERKKTEKRKKTTAP
jgi:hypothetical protein